MDQIMLHVTEPDLDREELVTAARQLRDTLLDLDVQNVQLGSADTTPDGARSAAGADIAVLLVTVAQNPSLLVDVFKTASAWASRRPKRSVEIRMGGDTLVLGAASIDQQDALVDAFLAGHQNY